MMSTEFKLNTFLNRIGTALGCTIVFCACVSYAMFSFNWAIWAVWLVGLSVCAARFYLIRAKAQGKISRLDIATTCALFIIALPVYVWSLYTLPFQVGVDEVTAIFKEQAWMARGANDIFGLADYYGFTYFHFLLEAWLAKLMGGVNLYQVRLVHASVGVLIVPCSFIFFRVIGLRWLLALAATIFMCTNHSLVALSRMANVTNFSVLIELCALSLLFDGFKRKCPFTTYLGGLVSGVGFYIYYPARIVMPIWIVFLLLLFLFRRSENPGTDLRRSLAICLLGLTLTIAPLAVAHLLQPTRVVDSLEFQRRQCLLFPEGRQLAASWTPEKTISAGITQNIRNGLTAFNNNIQDYGWTYQNPNHGFVDPLSGVLLWLGFLWIVLKRRAEPAPLLMLSGFLIQLFSCAFIVTKAPNYTRLLVILPFAAYFVAQGIDSISLMCSRLVSKLSERYVGLTQQVVFLSASFAVVAWNFFILYQYFAVGTIHGDPIGSTVRYVESKKGQTNHLFITAASADYPYYAWEVPSSWTARIQPFLTGEQDCRAFSPDDLTRIEIVPPFTFLMNGSLWAAKRDQLLKMYPDLVVHKIADSGNLVAVEDATVTADSARVHAAYRQWLDCLSRLEHLISAQRYAETEQLCLEALKAPEAQVNGSDFKARVLYELGAAQMGLKKYSDAEKTFHAAMDTRVGLAGNNDYETASYANALAEYYVSQHKWADAEVWFRKVNKIRAASEDRYTDMLVPFYAGTYRSIALACWHQGKYQEAENNLVQARSLYRQHPERNTWESAEINRDLDICRQDRLNHKRNWGTD